MIRALVTAISVIATTFVLLAAETQAHPAWGIAIDRQGQIYFSELKSVWKIDAQGKLSLFRADGHTHELNLDEAGNVYGEHDFSAIWKMTPAGSFSYLFPPAAEPPRGVGIWRDPEGNMYSVEQNNHLRRATLLLKRTPSGNVSVLAGSNYGHADGKGGQARFRNIVGMTFGPDGSLYLVDGSSIRKVTMDGVVTTLAPDIMLENAAGKSAGGSSLLGIAVDAKSNVFAADYGNRRVLKIASDGQMSTLIRSEESWFPTGVAERAGELYILEESHTPAFKPLGTRVRKLLPDGRVTILAAVGEKRTSSDRPSNGETSSDNEVEGIAGQKQNAPYALLGVGAGTFALACIVWRIRRSIYERQRRDG